MPIFADVTSDIQTSDFIFTLRIEDDISNDIPDLESMFTRNYEVVEQFSRYESTGFKFRILPVGSSSRTDNLEVPDEIFDFFGDGSSRKKHSANAKSRPSFDNPDLTVSFDMSFFAHHKNNVLQSNFKIADKTFSNNLRLDYNKDGYLVLDTVNYKINENFSFFNHFWSFADNTQLKISDGGGLNYTKNGVRYSYGVYGGYDIYKKSALGGSSFFVKFNNFDMGGYLSYRNRQFNAGSKLEFIYTFFQFNGYFDFLTDFIQNVSFQPDFSADFSIFPVNFAFFKVSDTFDSNIFNSVRDEIKKINYNTDKIKSVAGARLYADLNKIDLSVLTSFYSVGKDFLLIDQSASWISPEFFAECSMRVNFAKFKLFFGNNVNIDFSPIVNFGTTVGVQDISVKYILMGFFADFEIENNLTDYKIVVRTEILSDFAKNLTFFIKSFNEFYFNKLSIDFYIQAGFKTML